ncbi:transketolase family protein, partial [Candidatus Uhrbacteria bacterium]|nr:transketolase family protein [Candidatus Uhrbacteria bacterium]
MEHLPTRNGYGDGLVLAGRQNPNVVVLCCDLTESTRSLAFQKEFPQRFIEVGVAEQNMIGLAAGMAAYGKVPF